MYNIILFIGALLILFVFFKLVNVPTKIIIKFLINSLLGGAILFILSKFGGKVGLENISINQVSAVITGFLGIPGTIIVAVLQTVGIL